MSVLENKSILAKELEDLAIMLNSHSLCDDVQPLYSAQSECNTKSDTDYWTYKLNPLTFKTNKIGHTLPTTANSLKVTLSLEIKAHYCSNTDLYDPIYQETNKPLPDYFEYNFNIEIEGLAEVDNDIKEVYSSWHLDKDLESVGVSKFYHPLYHFTFGGRKMLDKGEIYGQTLILPTPRIAHPPMDAILGIDFILQNFMDYKTHEKLTTHKDYKILLQKAQNRLWKPYYAAIGEHWKGNFTTFDKSLDRFQLIPNLK